MVDPRNVASWEWEITSGRARFSPAWARLFGLPEETLDATIDTWSDRIHPDDLTLACDAVNALLSGATQTLWLPLRMQHADGSWLRVIATGGVLQRLPDGTPWLFRGRLDSSA